MKKLFIILFLVLFSTPLFAEEPPVADRFGPLQQWYQAPLLKSKHIKVKQVHERIATTTINYGNNLVSKARSYIGTNPTGWRHVWCGRFQAMIAPEAAKRISNPNRARSWGELTHISPQIGAIAVISRGKHGGHVGIVSGFDPHDNPIIISGNHGHTVGEGVYLKGRILAYVSAY